MPKRIAALAFPAAHLLLLPLLGGPLLGAAPPAVAGGPQPPLAQVRVTPSELGFEPLVDTERWTIVVSGPDDIRFSKEVAGEAPSILLADIEAAAGTAPDGVYVYDLIAVVADRRQHPAAEPLAELGGEMAPSPPPKPRRQVQFGHFSVRQGAIVVSERREVPSRRDPLGRSPATRQVIAENLAVQGDLCAGSADCTDSDLSFFQVIRIKGSNTRLEFSDTSTVPNFPATDWELTANGSAEFSPAFFAVTDADTTNKVLYIEAGAPQNTLYLESDGDVGLGTMSPATKLHVAGAATIDGDLSVLSSRAAKRDLAPVSGVEILRGLERLPIVTWRYIADPREARHLGPTAEEFHDIFGLGASGEHLSPVDAAGIALASAQQLQRLVRGQQRELDELRAQRDELARRLDALEAVLAAQGPR